MADDPKIEPTIEELVALTLRTLTDFMQAQAAVNASQVQFSQNVAEAFRAMADALPGNDAGPVMTVAA